MTELAALADRVAIGELLDSYALAIDDRDFAAVAAVFTDDAVLDYSSAGGPSGDVETVLGWLRESLPAVALTQHLLTNRRITVDGDRAAARCELLNPLLFGSDGGMHLLLLGGRYDDELVRTRQGWRISSRRHTTAWTAGPFPAQLAPPEA